MGDMRASHQETFIADDSLAAAGDGAGVDGRVFADEAIGADPDGCILATVAKMLRRAAKDGERIDDCSCADRCSAVDDDV